MRNSLKVVLLGLLMVPLLTTPLRAQNTAESSERLVMYVGEVVVMELAPVKRVAVGNSSTLSTSITESGQLILIAEGQGDSGIHIWFEDGTEEDILALVTAQNDERTASEIRTLMSAYEGIEFWEIGNKTYLRGELDPKHRLEVDKIMEIYPSIVDLTTEPTAPDVDIDSMLKAFGDITTTRTAGKTVLQGQIDPAYEEALKALLTAFPDLINLTQLQKVTQDKMVYMNVKITEFRTSDLQNLGVNWQKDINGPSAVYGVERPLQGAQVGILNSPTEGGASLSPRTQGDLINSVGYFGIATAITSRINLLLESGNALLIAEPRLSTRSGGEASFLSGGEIPIIVRSSEGNNVEYKEFGIRLKMSPIVDNKGNVVANVETELSAVDNSIQSEAGPAFITRRTKTDISMREGDTLVISGLVSQEWSNASNGLKGLSELPLLGSLFKSKDFQARKSELVIFVTPTVVDPSKVNEADIASRRLLRGFESTSSLKGIID